MPRSVLRRRDIWRGAIDTEGVSLNNPVQGVKRHVYQQPAGARDTNCSAHMVLKPMVLFDQRLNGGLGGEGAHDMLHLQVIPA